MSAESLNNMKRMAIMNHYVSDGVPFVRVTESDSIIVV